jgi:citrate lyase subunit beta/citryl-CoA lyase
MNDMDFIRTALFVPGNRPDRVDKAVGVGADMVIIDLEDAVPLRDKVSTRQIVRKKIEKHAENKLMVRVNSLESGLVQGDLEEIVTPGLDAVMLPKVEKSEDIVRIHAMLVAVEQRNQIDPGSLALVALIETALGVENAFQIASTKTEPDRLHTLAFGAADFTLDMGIRISKTGEELFYPRTRLAIACRAACIKPPLDTPFMIDLKDQEALRLDILRGRDLGFGGKLCIHPNQIDICNYLYSPSQEELEYAAQVVQVFEEAEANGIAAIQVNGKFIDYPVVEQSRRILKIAARMKMAAEES